MKSKSYFFNTFISSLLFFYFGCSENQSDEKVIQKALLQDGFITSENLGKALSVIEARKEQLENSEVIVEGFIGGRKEPFTEKRAVFILGDNSLETCDKKADDNCPTPWDVCCEDKKKVAASTISIQVLDSNGSLLTGTLDGLSGLKPGVKVRVKGNIDDKSEGNVLIINAIKIELVAD